MKLKYQILLSLLYGLFICNVTQAQNTSANTHQEIREDTLLFQFVPGKLLFLADYKENKESIQTLTQLVRINKPSIDSGDIKVRVLGFCSSYESVKENLAAAKNRSNQVKSYLIVHEGLKEGNFRTTNSTRQWRGLTDAVVITYLFETKTRESSTFSKSQQDTVHSIEKTLPQEDSLSTKEITKAKSDSSLQIEHPLTKKENQVISQESSFSQTDTKAAAVEKDRPYRWAIKTNMAYWAATVANLGIEYSFGKHYSIDLPIIYSPYTIARDYQLRLLAVQPELRYWLRNPMQAHFFGVHLNIGAFNIAVDSKNRYQSPDGFYGVGLSYGYMLPFARHWAAEFTIGAGYVHSKYDSFYNIPNGACYKKGASYNYWGLTKIGIGVLYRFGK